ncbi:lipid asymmetry maintenance protein MlaB [Ideonella sp.]|uniref:STAS domain-containing protein n=1 Tax=Ideonella sp. TaxID=1929293 RepID=UPI0035B1F0F9
MSEPSTLTPPPGRVRLEGEVTIYHAASQKALLIDALAGCGGTLELDLSDVTEIDTAGLQLLMLLKRTAVRQGQALRLIGCSPAVSEVLELVNVAGLFGGPLSVDGQAGDGSTP